MQVSSSSTFKAKKSFILLKDTLNALDNFDNRQEIVKLLICKIMYIYIYIYIYIYTYIFWKCIQDTIHWAKTQMLKKFLLELINGTK